jgi:mannosyltransferase
VAADYQDVTTRHVLLVTFVLALAAAARLFHLQERVVWFDEANSLLIAKTGLREIVAFARDDTHPPLYNLVLGGWTRLWPGETGARMFSVICGVLAVAMTGVVGWRIAGPLAGCLSAALMALCPLHVWYSQEVRMYALQTVLVSLSWLALLREKWFGYALVSALALYTQYTSAFALMAQTAYLVCCRREQWQQWLAAQAGIAGLFLPGVPLFLHHYFGRTFGYWMSEFSWGDPVRFFALLSGAIQKNPGPYWPWVCLSLAVVGAAGTILYRRNRETTIALLLWLLVPVVLLAVTSLRGNAFLPRALVFVAPAFCLLVGWGATVAGWGGRVAIVLLLAANSVALGRYYFAENVWLRSPLRAVSETISREMQPGDVVVHSSEFSYRPMQFYLGEKVPQAVAGDGPLPENALAARRLWLVLWADFRHPQAHKELLTWMNSHHSWQRTVYDSAQLYVAVYERRDVSVMPE